MGTTGGGSDGDRKFRQRQKGVAKVVFPILITGAIINVIFSNIDTFKNSENGTLMMIDAPQVFAAGNKKPTISTSNMSICETSSRGWEVVFESLLGNIFREEGFLSNDGNVLDVGAQFGEQACHFALLAPHRQVYAMDPSPANTDKIKNSAFGSLPNLNIITKGIGKENGTMVVPDGSFQMPIGDTFEVVTMDSLFYEQGNVLAFAHIDVEGLELDVLHGGEKSIREYKPVFTVELRVHKDVQFSKALLEFVNDLGYDSYVVDEVCGYPHMDYRNLINIPRSLSPKLEYSDAFSFALFTEAIFRVDSTTVFEKVYPVCAVGAECCANGNTSDKSCCSQTCVMRWLDRTNKHRPIAFKAWNPSRRATMQQWAELRERGRIE